jgi:hypothetical protein
LIYYLTVLSNMLKKVIFRTWDYLIINKPVQMFLAFASLKKRE